jgi:tetratricopeptide (TPR) repeat protein/DNA-binding XRE family transcriptional regulator
MPDHEKPRNPEGGRRWAVLRATLRLDQQDLAKRARLAPSAISEIEADLRTPEAGTEDRLTLGLGCTAADTKRAAWLLQGVPGHARREAARLALDTLAFAVEDSMAARVLRPVTPSPAVERIAAFLPCLSSYTVENLRQMIEDVPELQTRTFFVALCEESARLARKDTQRAAALAELAFDLANWMPLYEERQRPAYQGDAQAFIANAFRVQGNLLRAKEAFEQADALWEAVEPADLSDLDRTRSLGLRASLLCDERNLEDAIFLLDQALEAGPRGPVAWACLLIKKAKVYEELNQPDIALDLLEQAAPFLEQEPCPLLMCSHRSMIVGILWLLHRAEDAERWLGEAQALAEQLGTDLDKLRLRWLEGRIDASLGRRHEAIDKLRGVRAEFQERKIAYDTALVTLELSALLLEQGETAEVKELAKEMLRIFAEQEVPQEAEKAFRIFCEAALQETATLELVRRILTQMGQK